MGKNIIKGIQGRQQSRLPKRVQPKANGNRAERRAAAKKSGKQDGGKSNS